jgi:predicted esterase
VRDRSDDSGEAARYAVVSARVGTLYEREEYDAALAVINAERATLPRYLSDLAHLAACLHALAGNPVAALRDLQNAAAEGAWWHPRLLLDDDDLAAVRQQAGFDAVVAEAAARSAAAQSGLRARPPVVLRPEGGAAARGLLVVLHGAGQDAAGAAARWSAASGAGWVLVAVDSSQLSTPTYRTWPDQEVAAADVAAALATLGPDDQGLPVVAGGFSAGARAALLWAISAQPVPVAGVVAVSPAVWPEQTSGATDQPTGVVLIGADDDLLPTTRDAVEPLPGVRLEVLDGLGHDYPAGFDSWLTATLEEVLTQP